MSCKKDSTVANVLGGIACIGGVLLLMNPKTFGWGLFVLMIGVLITCRPINISSY